MQSFRNFFYICLIIPVVHAIPFSQPVLIKKIDISAAGTGKRMLLGDVTGDGRLEFVMMQADKMDDDRYIGHQVNCLTAYDCDGKKLWQVGDPSKGASAGSDIPAQVYDIDQDGFNEVLACMNGKLRILNGKDGKEKSSFSYPHQNAHDCIIIANLTGKAKAQDIILKDRYDQIWAMDRTGKQLWTYKGNTGHFPWPFDFDNDGRDEIFCGYDYLTPDGKKLWSMNQQGHADCIWVGDIDQNPSNGTEIAVGGDDVTVYHQDGKLMWRNDQPVEPQNITIGDFLPDQPGLEIAGQDRVDRSTPGKEAIFVISSTGKTSYYQTRSGWGSIAYMCRNWNDKGADHLMIWRGPEKPALFDGKVKKVASFEEGYMMAGDINGDGSDEIIIFTEESAFIYSNKEFDITKVASSCPAPRPQQKRHYLFTRYWGGEYVKNEITTGNLDTRLEKASGTDYQNTLRIHNTSTMITLTTYSHNSTFQIFDLQGKRVTQINTINATTHKVNLDDKSRGTYLLRVSKGDLRAPQKMLSSTGDQEMYND